jgi:hypothetical protein
MTHSHAFCLIYINTFISLNQYRGMPSHGPPPNPKRGRSRIGQTKCPTPNVCAVQQLQACLHKSQRQMHINHEELQAAAACDAIVALAASRSHSMISTWHCPIPMWRLQNWCCLRHSCSPCSPSPPAVQDSDCLVLRQYCWAAALSVGRSDLIESPTRYRCSRVWFQQQPQHSRTRHLDVCVRSPVASKD